MREIKFRIRDKATNKIISLDNYLYDLLCWDGLSWRVQEICSGERGESVEVNLEHYTNRKDKNNKEIYEGDVVEYSAEDRLQKFEIKHNSKYMCFDLYNFEDCEFHDSKTSDKNHYKVIGNIYDNPELLKESE